MITFKFVDFRIEEIEDWRKDCIQRFGVPRITARKINGHTIYRAVVKCK